MHTVRRSVSLTGFSPSPINLPRLFSYTSSSLCMSLPVSPLPDRVWPPPLSLATTHGISFDFSSSAYLDVSLRRVPLITLFDSCNDSRFFTVLVSQFGNPRIKAYLQLPAAYRSLSRPSSAPDAKAFSLCSFSLELPRIPLGMLRFFSRK